MIHYMFHIMYCVNMYSIALKACNSKICLDLNKNETVDVEAWLDCHLRSGGSWKCELFYNDEPPVGPCFSGGGHCKGVIVWNNDEVGWLIHSVPKWPSVISNSIPNPECEYGQSFAWIKLPISALPNIISQIQLMHAHVYHDPNQMYKPYLHAPSILINLIKLTDNIYHIAKHEKWNDDIFEHGLANDFPNSKWKSETWSRPEQPSTEHVNRIHGLCWDKFKYNEKQDHSKWVISDKNTSMVCIGDMNAMSSQFKRGGGFLLIKNEVLWNHLNSIIIVQLRTHNSL
jgi:hypothetical protein